MFSKSISRKTDKQIWRSVYPFFNICFQGVDSRFCREDGAEFGSFSDNRKLIGIQFDVFFLKKNQFRHSQSCSVQKLENCEISRLLEFVFGEFERCGEDSSDLFIIEIIHFSRWCFGKFQLIWTHAIDIVLQYEFQKGSDGHDMIVDGSDIQSIFMKRHSVVEELHTVHFADFDVTHKFQKPIQSETIILRRLRTYVFFVFQIVHVLLEQCTDGGRGNFIFEK